MMSAPLMAQGEVAPVSAASLPAVAGTPLKLDIPVRLMVMREVTTKTAHAGDRFPLRVDQAVVVDGATLIPAGTAAWGEVVAATESGFVGKSGKLSAKLLFIEFPDHRRIGLRGETMSAGTHGAATTVYATVGFALLGAGPLGLMTRGTNAKLKAGEIVVGYVGEDPMKAAAPEPAK